MTCQKNGLFLTHIIGHVTLLVYSLQVMAYGLNYFCLTTASGRRFLFPVHRYEKDSMKDTHQLLTAFFVRIPIDEISDTQCQSNSKKSGGYCFPV